MKAKRIYGFISSLLAAMMVFGMFSCGGKGGKVDSSSLDETSSTEESTESSAEDSSQKHEDEYFLPRGENEKQLTI
ncbi:MAG: hypothetical protein IIX02_03345 [Clostridia bacterium]|nr:hypothetical protein [Clostridia bacterium]